MIRVPDAALSDATAEALQAYQAEIDGESQYEQRVAIAAARSAAATGAIIGCLMR